MGGSYNGKTLVRDMTELTSDSGGQSVPTRVDVSPALGGVCVVGLWSGQGRLVLWWESLGRRERERDMWGLPDKQGRDK